MLGLTADQPPEQNCKLHIVNVLNAHADGVFEPSAEEEKRNGQLVLFLTDEGVAAKEITKYKIKGE